MSARARLRLLFVALFVGLLQAPASAQNSGCSPDDVLLGTTPAPPQTREGERAFEEQKARFSRPAEIVLAGDSLTARWSSAALAGLAPHTVLNLGVEGDGVQHLLWRLSHSPLATQAPKLVTLLIGTNNLGVGNSECVVEVGLDAVLATLSRAWPKTPILVFGLPKRGPALDFRETDRLAVNRHMRRMADEHPQVHYVDLDQPLACGDAVPCVNYAADMLHLAAPAYETMTAILRRALPGG